MIPTSSFSSLYIFITSRSFFFFLHFFASFFTLPQLRTKVPLHLLLLPSLILNFNLHKSTSLTVRPPWILTVQVTVPVVLYLPTYVVQSFNRPVPGITECDKLLPPALKPKDAIQIPITSSAYVVPSRRSQQRPNIGSQIPFRPINWDTFPLVVASLASFLRTEDGLTYLRTLALQDAFPSSGLDSGETENLRNWKFSKE